MSILHWNIHGLCYLLSIYEPHVICLQETFLVQPPTPIPNYHFIHSHSIAASAIIRHHILTSTLTQLLLVLCYKSSFNIGLQLFITHSLPTLYIICNTPFSVPHILLFCLYYTAVRATAFPHLSHLSWPAPLNDTLTESPHFHLDNIISFLQHIHILHLI